MTDEGPRPRAYLHGMNVGWRVAHRTSLWCGRVAGLLRDRGAGMGTTVGVMLPDVTEFGVVAYGVLWAGGVVAPIRPLLSHVEIGRRTAALGARFLFAWHAVAEDAETAAARSRIPCVFVVPGEFTRLLRTVEPVPRPAPRAPSDPAVILPDRVVTHGELAGGAGMPDLYALTDGRRLY